MDPGTPENPSQADYHLKPGTLAVNGGDSFLYAPGLTPDISSVTTDLNGHSRFQGTSVDLGAYEGNSSAVDLWELY